MKEGRMKLDIRFREGDRHKPLAVFIHGLGMDADFWTDPARARVLGGRYPLSILVGKDVEMRTSYQDLEGLGFGVITWSESRPAGPIEAAERELGQILREYKEHAKEGLLFICHSRGGLVVRKYLEGGADTTRTVITLSSPHGGT